MIYMYVAVDRLWLQNIGWNLYLIFLTAGHVKYETRRHPLITFHPPL